MVKGKGIHSERIAALFALLSFMALAVHAIDTVNLVDFCGQIIKGNGMIVNSHKESRKYYFVAMGTDCQLTMEASSPKDKIQFQFRFFLVYSLLRVSTSATKEPPETPRPGDPCQAGSYVQFYDGKGRNAVPLGPPLCGKSIPRPILSTGNYLTLRLVTRGQQPRVDFVGDFTSFRLGFNYSECHDGPYFHCQNGKCIPMSLVCDNKGIDNCGDGSDQSIHPPAQCKDKSTHSSLLALYITLGLIVGVALLFWCCWSPGWFIWRVSACRFYPCCNSFCASCHLCARSCVWRDKSRPGKVTPHDASSTPM
ncbi:low-density lipoprotein receptor class A domain-containing protein 2 [Rhinatrema bivittatum]|uniref:low-density lipoprotein receptor class A domain-containing protein 2 n=1 Tax=Rhinatrema bivittatum TaxID=194408 RepID=UPI001129EB3B|nr:low-density lipoprotein receptor class A domain-containing protein 2 [Rhinatrema bivittatum]